jgi:hypothetical protein
MKPNIFDYATRELSQDAFIAWLINYADPRKRDHLYTFDDEGLYACGTKLIREMLFTHDITLDAKIAKVSADCQWEGIDIWAKVELANGKKYLIIIEDKTNTIQHSNQLERYRQTAIEHCNQNGFAPPVCIYLKTGNEAKSSLENVKRHGFRVVDRKTVILIMSDYRQIHNRIFNDFYDRMTKLESSIHEYDLKPIGEWSNGDWQGFFGYLDIELGLTGWNYVNNPGGGFWNAVLNWDYWNGFPVYLQIEQGKLAFKISTEEEETQMDSDARAAIRNELHELIMDNAASNPWYKARRPARFGNGVVMTAAIVDQKDWMGKENDLIDKVKVKENLDTYLKFLRTSIEEKVDARSLGVGE